MKAGTTNAVRNDGAQPHELVMFGLAAGKTPQDVLAFLSSPAPPHVIRGMLATGTVTA